MKNFDKYVIIMIKKMNTISHFYFYTMLIGEKNGKIGLTISDQVCIHLYKQRNTF